MFVLLLFLLMCSGGVFTSFKARNKKCNGDIHAVCKKCPNPCPLTCTDPNLKPCSSLCLRYGCECAPGYVLGAIGEKCVALEDCPKPTCPKNAKYEINHEDCLKTCANRLVAGNPEVCAPYTGCVCNPGYVKKYDNGTGICIPLKECPPIPEQCGINEVRTSCAIFCPPQTCESIYTSYKCFPRDCEPGCNCKDEYLRDSDGVCTKDCFEDDQECSDPNASPQNCPRSCQPTCAQPDTSTLVCTRECLVSGCVCNPGYILDITGGECILISECPDNQSCNGDQNATIQECPDPCPNTCADPNTSDGPCMSICLPTGCDCKLGYILTEKGGKCILPEDCPDCKGDPNAMPQECPNPCPPTCRQPDASSTSCNKNCDSNGCVCKDGYILNNEGGKCVEPKLCPGGIPKCPTNKTFTYCNDGCPTHYCPEDDSWDMIACDQPLPCPAGCRCKTGYLLLSYEQHQCILSSECPPVECTRPNEIWDPAPLNCNLEYCENMNSECLDMSRARLPKCVCKPGYYRNQSDICIPASECSCNGDPNASRDECPSFCPRTCAQPDTNELICIDACDPSGCVCNRGYILSEKGGICVRPEDCPECYGDPNAVFDECPNACPITCEEPDDTGTVCTQACDTPGCVCRPGYIATIKGGPCVLPEDCPGGTPSCGANKTFVSCKFGCPTNYCPQSDTRAIVACMLPFICYPGCVCSPNHLMMSYDDPRCLLSSDCPPVECTRPNEVWEPSPPYCFFERCDERDIPCDFPTSNSPRCVCEQGYYRNEEDICIPESECLVAATCSIPDQCIRTCAEPNPLNCPYEPAETNIHGCECIDGYILSELGGVCIKVEDCNVSCSGDPHARAKFCPQPCPSTCDSPNAVACLKMCEPIACECESGYLLSEEGGLCILPDECPEGNPCGVNEEFHQCRSDCPQDYCPVDDNTDDCDSWSTCLSGCACKMNYRRLSYENDTCIVASDCPPVECTRPNEVWNGCPDECFSGLCKDREYENETCNNEVLNCQPKCVCKTKTYRNAKNICVPASECPPYCPIPDECIRTCAAPNNPSCRYIPVNANIEGCLCIDGYILSEFGGICIRIEDCPSNLGCNGDPNARPKKCPVACPSTCDSPNAIQCRKRREPIGCECKPRYILQDGQCILPKNCPGGNPCGANGTFVFCRNECHLDYCPVNDSRDIVECDASTICLSGCVCKLNHRRLSLEDRRCILSSDCPPVDCTRPNEKWSSCPSACLAEDCDDVDNQPSTCNPLVQNFQPQCICKKKHFRNSSDICVPSSKCG